MFLLSRSVLFDSGVGFRRAPFGLDFAAPFQY
jgi:hypothetical protein